MTAQEYLQLRAYSRLDGLRLSVLWIASFACYVWGLRRPELGMFAIGMALFTPVLMGLRLRSFRDGVMDGSITFGRGWVYTLFMSFYACIIFALAQFVYFQWIDNGFFVEALGDMVSAPESAPALQQLGMMRAVEESLSLLASMRPIDLVLNIMGSNMMICCVVGLPVAAIMKRDQIRRVK